MSYITAGLLLCGVPSLHPLLHLFHLSLHLYFSFSFQDTLGSYHIHELRQISSESRLLPLGPKPSPPLIPSPLAIPFLFRVLFGRHFREVPGSVWSELTLLSNGLNSSASASSGCLAETNQPGSASTIPQGASMLLTGRLPSPSTSYYPSPPVG